MVHWVKDVHRDREESLQEELETIAAARQARRLVIVKAIGILLALASLVLIVDAVRRITFPATGGLVVGEAARVSNSVLAGVDEDAWEEVLELQARDDQVALNMLERTGRAFMVAEGTTVLVLDAELGSAQVRVQDGRSEGKTGWMHPGRLVPLGKASPNSQ